MEIINANKSSEIFKNFVDYYNAIENPMAIFNYIDSLETSDTELRQIYHHLSADDFDKIKNIYNKVSNQSEYCLELYKRLTEKSYIDAVDFLQNKLLKNNMELMIKNLDKYICLSIDVKPNNNNFEKIDENNIYLKEDLLHRKDNKKASPIFFSIIKDSLAVLQYYVGYDNYILESLSNFDEKDLYEYFDTENLNYHPQKLIKFINILSFKGSEEFARSLDYFIGKYSSGERIQLIEDAFYAVDSRFYKKENRDDFLKSIPKNNILAQLTRGELQKFITSCDINVDYKLALIASSNIELFKEDERPLHDMNSTILAEMYKYIDHIEEQRNDIVENRNDYKNYYYDDDKLIDSKLNVLFKYEIINLKKILFEKNLPQRYKWLDEATDYFENKRMYESYANDYENVGRYYTNFILCTIREFYDNLDIDYDKYNLNDNLVKKVYYGIELEEEGYLNDNNIILGSKFKDVFDGSIKHVIKGQGKSYNTIDGNTREFVSKVFDTSDKKDYKNLIRFLDDIAYVGGKPNCTCGFHIHVSNDYTDNIDIDDLILKFGLPKDFDSKNHVEINSSYDEEDLELYKMCYKNPGFDGAYKISKEIYYMQELLIKKFNVYKDRVEKTGFARKLESINPDMSEKYSFVNFGSLIENKGIEFRFLNLPDYTDKKVALAYIDFVTSYLEYIEEENETMEYFDIAVSEVFGDDNVLSKEELDDLRFDILLDELCLNEDTVKVIKNLDSIFELYNTKNVISNCMDYYTKYDKKIIDEENVLKDEELEI